MIDPTFGGCAFLAAALERYEGLGVTRGGERVFGVDIDPCVAGYARELQARGVPPKNLVAADFLGLSPEHFGHGFGAMVGNPPYVRHHRLDPATIDRGQTAVKALGVALPRTADLWAYIVIHALRFLAVDARLALLLPGAALHADYARPVLERLEMDFRSVDLVLVRDRLFEDASERTVVLLADGFGGGPCEARNHRVQDVEGIREILATAETGSCSLSQLGLEWNHRFVRSQLRPRASVGQRSSSPNVCRGWQSRWANTGTSALYGDRG